MSHYASLRPFGFSQPSKRGYTALPSDETVRSSENSTKSRRKSKPQPLLPPNDSFGPFWPAPPLHVPRTPEERSRRGLGDDNHGTTRPPCSPRKDTKRRPPRLQTSRSSAASLIKSAVSPTATKFARMQLRSPLSSRQKHFDVIDKQLDEQLLSVYSALRRVEEEHESVLGQMARGKVDRNKLERELEVVRKENQRLNALLDELLNNPMSKASSNAKSDDVWGQSVYD